MSPEAAKDYAVLQQAIDNAPERTPCESNPDAWFPEWGYTNMLTRQAVQLCATCPVLRECMEYGLKHEQHGIWGGLTPPERQRIMARRSGALAS